MPSQSPIIAQAESLRQARSNPPQQSLASIEVSLAANLTAITTKIAGFEDTILLDRLKVGRDALKAHVLFSVSPNKRKGIGGRGKTASTVDGVSGEGFEGWLAERYHPVNHPLKKGTAYNWMTALRGLGLDENATDEDIETALNQNRRIGPVSIKSLCAAAVEAIAPPPEPPHIPQQTEFEFLREGLAQFRQECEHILSLKPQLEENPEMKRVAAARAYALLSELTGTNWKPSDEPDDLASVNPDSIEL
jgi:hypothetical protein